MSVCGIVLSRPVEFGKCYHNVGDQWWSYIVCLHAYSLATSP